MEYVGIITLLVLGALVLFAVVSILLSIRLRRTGISKDYAEQVAMRKFTYGQVIGARFTREGKKWIWELDILDQGQINRVSVDARAAIVLNVRIMAGKPYPTTESRFYGKRAEPFP